MIVDKFENIYIIVVLYKTTLNNSETIQSLFGIEGFTFEVMVYDNSPVKQYDHKNFTVKNISFTYLHNKDNPGLSYAYNVALKRAALYKKSWMLLLDQDTLLNSEFINELKVYDNNNLDKSVVALIPKVKTTVNERVISPTVMKTGGICRPIDLEPGIVTQYVGGINSGTLLRVSFMESLGGFSNQYSLDMLDHWYFREITFHKKHLLLLKSTIKQDLSIYGNFETNLSIKRYRQLIAAESRFIASEGFTSRAIFKLRLILRSLKQLHFENKEYVKTTIKHLMGFH